LESGNGDNTGEAEPEIVTFAEQMPEFGDDPAALAEFLSRNINYPEMAKANGQEGKVIVQFVVGRDGKISDIEVLKKGGWGFDEAALEVVKKMPAWKPAKQNGKAVPLRMTLPIKFTLQN
jgi:protein TonB